MSVYDVVNYKRFVGRAVQPYIRILEEQSQPEELRRLAQEMIDCAVTILQQGVAAGYFSEELFADRGASIPGEGRASPVRLQEATDYSSLEDADRATLLYECTALNDRFFYLLAAVTFSSDERWRQLLRGAEQDLISLTSGASRGRLLPEDERSLAADWLLYGALKRNDVLGQVGDLLIGDFEDFCWVLEASLIAADMLEINPWESLLARVDSPPYATAASVLLRDRAWLPGLLGRDSTYRRDPNAASSTYTLLYEQAQYVLNDSHPTDRYKQRPLGPMTLTVTEFVLGFLDSGQSSRWNEVFEMGQRVLNYVEPSVDNLG